MKLVILDRDGVINEDSEAFVKSHLEWRPIPGSLEAIAQLHQNGYRVVVATNQSGIGRGLFDMQALNAIHTKMHRALASVGARVEAIFVCPHTAADHCDCRKPKPGLFHQIANRFGIDLAGTPMVGDSERDLVAGAAVRGQVILVQTGKGAQTLARGNLPEGTAVFANLAGAVDHLLAQSPEI